jgi:hydroxyacylglutathione hydrolase
MIFRPYYYFDMGCAAYLFGCGTLGKGTVVDARADDIDSYITFAAAKNLRLTHVIDTHVHADHLSGGPELARRTGAQYCVHESADLMFPFSALRDGDELDALSDVPPKPAEMGRVLASNRGHEKVGMHG